MPFLEGPFAFTGKLDMLSAYRMRGVDGIVIRRKGGPSREKIKTSPSFKNTRHTMSEFGGCSRLGSYVRLAMHSIRQLSDYNFGSDINSIMRQVQLRDDTGAWGRRKITLSEHARILEGFQTTKKAPSFDSIIRTPVYYTMDRANRAARVEIPELLRDINYFPQNNHAMFRLTITLGIVPDLRYDVPEKEYLPAKWYDQACYAKSVSTAWNPSLEGMGSTALDLAMDMLPPEGGWTLMLAIGIQYGSFRENGKIDEVKRFGAAKILALRGKDGASAGGADDGGHQEAEVDFVDEVVTEDAVTEDVAADGNEVEQRGYREPEVRYVYTMKDVAGEKRESIVYCYTISTSDTRVATTTDADAGELNDTKDQSLQLVESEGSRKTAAVRRWSDELPVSLSRRHFMHVDSVKEDLANDGVVVFGSFVNLQDFKLQAPRWECCELFAIDAIGVADVYGTMRFNGPATLHSSMVMGRLALPAGSLQWPER
ncbi:hypothetical protein KK078_12415 [Fulvivirgaceae bacterium PWU37]|uniref:Uncharacterized protein n=1 Tax=Dawidia soli TaxID=2782352 RepID=A0AAP2GHM8_9BACT|nr:hypothetical protein [Dawidia soli]MBT1687366.1 hypothetical protein [Dawidia soli]